MALPTAAPPACLAVCPLRSIPDRFPEVDGRAILPGPSSTAGPTGRRGRAAPSTSMAQTTRPAEPSPGNGRDRPPGSPRPPRDETGEEVEGGANVVASVVALLFAGGARVRSW